MDLLAHACYGATICSRSGLAGGRNGFSRKRWFLDRTVWLAVMFSLLPDMVSMWIPFALFIRQDTGDNFFVWYGGEWLVVYRLVHSLVPALLCAGVLFFAYRKFFVPSLAWTVHIACDAVSHDGGKFSTMPFYPLSTFNVDGIAFWRNTWFVMTYYGLLVALWMSIIIWRYRACRSAAVQNDQQAAGHLEA